MNNNTGNNRYLLRIIVTFAMLMLALGTTTLLKKGFIGIVIWVMILITALWLTVRLIRTIEEDNHEKPNDMPLKKRLLAGIIFIGALLKCVGKVIKMIFFPKKDSD